MTEVRVKKLEWGEGNFDCVIANTPFGLYRVFSDGGWCGLHSNGFIAKSNNPEEAAKVAAQADFERRVLSCLEMPNE